MTRTWFLEATVSRSSTCSSNLLASCNMLVAGSVETVDLGMKMPFFLLHRNRDHNRSSMVKLICCCEAPMFKKFQLNHTKEDLRTAMDCWHYSLKSEICGNHEVTSFKAVSTNKFLCSDHIPPKTKMVHLRINPEKEKHRPFCHPFFGVPAVRLGDHISAW